MQIRRISLLIGGMAAAAGVFYLIVPVLSPPFEPPVSILALVSIVVGAAFIWINWDGARLTDEDRPPPTSDPRPVLPMERDRIFQAIADYAPVAFWVFNPIERRYLYISPLYDRIFAMDRRELYDDPNAFKRQIHPDDLDERNRAAMRAREGKTPFQARYRLKLGDGTIRWVWTYSYDIPDENGQTYLNVGFAQDITDVKAAERQEVELALERERRRLLTHFIQTVSHEFRTPLATINSSLYLLSRSDDPVKKGERLRSIEEQTQQILSLIEDMVMMTRMEQLAALRTEMVYPAPLLENSARRLMNEAERRSVGMTVEIADDLPPLPLATEEFIHAFKGLIENALRYTPSGGEVKIKARVEGRYLVVIISDNGVGMDAETITRAFEVFYRLDTAHSTPGIGLGLPLARRIAELHGGRLDVSSTPQQGTTVYMNLPIGKTAP